MAKHNEGIGMIVHKCQLTQLFTNYKCKLLAGAFALAGAMAAQGGIDRRIKGSDPFDTVALIQ